MDLLHQESHVSWPASWLFFSLALELSANILLLMLAASHRRGTGWPPCHPGAENNLEECWSTRETSMIPCPCCEIVQENDQTHEQQPQTNWLPVSRSLSSLTNIHPRQSEHHHRDLLQERMHELEQIRSPAMAPDQTRTPDWRSTPVNSPEPKGNTTKREVSAGDGLPDKTAGAPVAGISHRRRPVAASTA